MRVVILGGDGYLGWPTALRFSAQGHDVSIVDSLLKRVCHANRGTDSLTPIAMLPDRIAKWTELSGNKIVHYEVDATDYPALISVFEQIKPEVIIHYGQLPSAPYSMIDRWHAVQTQRNNTEGTLNVLWAMREFAPEAHLIKLGTMGEYGTPNIDIEEGYLEIEHHGRRDRLPYPKQPGSFYHLSKVHDSQNIAFAVSAWGLRATDLNQGIVYGMETSETACDLVLATRFDYDEVFGTALNRFCVQAVIGDPITVYGSGTQTRSFLNIRDTLQCVMLASLSVPDRGEYRVFNQFTEVFSIVELANAVMASAKKLNHQTSVEHFSNPRVECEHHYYNPHNSALLKLGLKPTYLSEELLGGMLTAVATYKDRVNRSAIPPRTRWT